MAIAKANDFRTWSKPAAVAVLITPGPRGPEVLLIERPSTMAEHAGQIACPGGRFDAVRDRTLWDTARRETQEEVGVPLSRTMWRGVLEPVYISVTGYTIEPHLFYLRSKPRLQSSSEVAAWHWVTIPDLRAVAEGSLEWPQYPLPWGRVWGATARIMSQLLRLPHSNGIGGPNDYRIQSDRGAKG